MFRLGRRWSRWACGVVAMASSDISHAATSAPSSVSASAQRIIPAVSIPFAGTAPVACLRRRASPQRRHQLVVLIIFASSFELFDLCPFLRPVLTAPSPLLSLQHSFEGSRTALPLLFLFARVAPARHCRLSAVRPGLGVGSHSSVCVLRGCAIVALTIAHHHYPSPAHGRLPFRPSLTPVGCPSPRRTRNNRKNPEKFVKYEKIPELDPPPRNETHHDLSSARNRRHPTMLCIAVNGVVCLCFDGVAAHPANIVEPSSAEAAGPAVLYLSTQNNAVRSFVCLPLLCTFDLFSHCVRTCQ